MSDSSITIDGVEVQIIAREKAVTDETMTPIASMQGKELKSVDKLLLSDDREMFQCVHPAKPDCGYTATTIRSVTAHQRTHSGAAVAKRAQAEIDEVTARANELERELNERKQAASDRAKRAAATRNENRANEAKNAPHIENTPVEVASAGPKGKGKPIGDEELAKMGQRVILAYNAMQDAADTFQNTLIGYLRAAQAASECKETPVDPIILEKAKRWDEMQALLNRK